YSVGVLVEEIIEKKVPILIIDPHGEYSSLKHPNDAEKEALKTFGLKPKAFKGIQEYGDTAISPDLRPLRLDNNLSAAEITALLPGKLSNSQQGLLYNSIKHLDKINFTNVLFELEKEENNAKWTIINNLDYLKGLDIFSDSFVPYNEMIQPGKCTIINLKGIAPDVQEIIVYKLLKDLFEMRKKEKVPPFFTVIEEAHNYCPERSFGETRCSKVIRTVASEGRKFGLGLCVISQRPARVDKSVLSQCTTQIILKITNPSDIKAVSSSVEGLTAESEEEIKNLSIGTALITGVVDMPLFVNIRPRMTEHGGHAAEMISEVKEEEFFEKVEEFDKKDVLPIVRPKLSLKDVALMSERKVKSVSISLVPGYLIFCTDKKMDYTLLVESVEGGIVTDLDRFRTRFLPELGTLSGNQVKLLHAAFKLNGFSEEDLIKQGMPLDIKSDLDALVALGYIEKNERYILSEKYIFSQLSKHACFAKIEFLELNYSHKQDPKISIDKMKERISKFAAIKDQRECFIAKYEVVFDD
ncbi:MAG: ATP-binding protein, partial [Nanoarchaeota archaeon]|nr:ATP-binding protein [Nanoarchaeota archaeon]